MNKRIRVLHLIKSLGRGGAETLLPETIKVHNSEGFEFHCIYFLPWKDQMVESLKNLGVQVICIEAKNNLQIIQKVPEVIKYIRENDIDLVHSHLPWAGFASRLIYKQMKRPTVYTEHNLQNRYHRVTRFLNKSTFNWQSLAVAVSSDVEKSILEHIKPTIPVRTVFNGVNTEHFIRNPESGSKIRQQLGIGTNDLVVGTLGVFRFQKRLDLWLEVFAQARQENPAIKGIVVGDGPLKQALTDKLKSLNLEEAVHMPGLQTNAVDWFSAMDIFMMSSEFEGLPLALLEAMSTECAIVTTDAGGVKEVIRNNIDGKISGVQESGGLLDNLNELIRDESQRSRLAKAARQRVLEGYSIAQMVTQLEATYYSLLNAADNG